MLSNISITNCSYAEKDSDSFTAYIVEFDTFKSQQHDSEVDQHASVKRFSEFFTFDNYLRSHGFSCLPPLPSRTLVKFFDAEFVAQRQAQLVEYMRRYEFAKGIFHVLIQA